MNSIYEELLARLEQNEASALETLIPAKSGAVAELTRRLVPVVPYVDGRGRQFARVTAEQADGALTVREPVLPAERLIILGGGHVGRELCLLGTRCGFAVTMVDDRPDFANRERFPEAAEVLCMGFEEAVAALSVTPYDYIVIVTRGHSHDADCLRAVLPGTMPAYLGMIGSRRRTTVQLQLLREEGYDAEKIARICTPIGLSIGAVTPAEIAVSILAEIIAYKRLPEHASEGRYALDTDVELSTLRFIASHRGPMAVATLIAAEGSAPRGAGAKMAILPDGSVVGSIGGGGSEAITMKKARALMGTGRYEILDFDLSGDASANDGLVCGGATTVLVEDAGTEV